MEEKVEEEEVEAVVDAVRFPEAGMGAAAAEAAAAARGTWWVM